MRRAELQLERRLNSCLTSRRVAQMSSRLSPSLSRTRSASTLSLLRYLATRTQTSFKHRKLSTRFELLVPYLLLPHTRQQSNLRSLNTSSTPGSHRRRLHHVCVCMARKRFELSPYARKICHAVTDRPSKSAFWSVRPSGVH